LQKDSKKVVLTSCSAARSVLLSLSTSQKQIPRYAKNDTQ
jgi:hypothetical protein